MTSRRKFWRTIVVLEILSEGDEAPDIENMSLEDIGYEIIDGGWSGALSVSDVKQLNGKEAAEGLLAQHSDPEFFRLNTNGEDLDD
jgi:hypothetical protein